MKTPSSFAELLRQERLHHSWTQDRLAEEIGTTRVTINRWELDVSTPSPVFWQRLTAFLHVPVDTLLLSDDDRSNRSAIEGEVVTEGSSSIPVLSLQDVSDGEDYVQSHNSVPIFSHDQSHLSEEKQLSFAQQQLALEEQRLELHRRYLLYVRDFVEIVLPLIRPDADADFRLRLLEQIFLLIEQDQKKSGQEFPIISFSLVKHAFMFARLQDESSAHISDLTIDKQSREWKHVPNGGLRKARLERNWTCLDVAERIGLPDANTISRWERRVNFPSAHYRQKLSELYGKSLEELGLDSSSSSRL